MNGSQSVFVVTTAADFRRVFINVANSGDRIIKLNMTAHGSEFDTVVLGNGYNESIMPKDYCDETTIGLRSKRDQDILRNAIDNHANIKLDICYGGQAGGLASAIKEAIPGASVTAYPGKVGSPYGIFSLPSVSWPWQQTAVTY